MILSSGKLLKHVIDEVSESAVKDTGVKEALEKFKAIATNSSIIELPSSVSDSDEIKKAYALSQDVAKQCMQDPVLQYCVRKAIKSKCFKWGLEYMPGLKKVRIDEYLIFSDNFFWCKVGSPCEKEIAETIKFLVAANQKELAESMATELNQYRKHHGIPVNFQWYDEVGVTDASTFKTK